MDPVTGAATQRPAEKLRETESRPNASGISEAEDRSAPCLSSQSDSSTSTKELGGAPMSGDPRVIGAGGVYLPPADSLEETGARGVR